MAQGNTETASEPYTFAALGQQAISFSGARPAVTAGQSYTFYLDTTSGIVEISYDTDTYSGGVLYSGSSPETAAAQPSVDLVFAVSFSDELPVELVAFEAYADGADAHLHWETASETNNAGFEVEHRADGDVAWGQLGFVVGKGTTAEAQHYEFRADGLPSGAHVFRLRQVDYDGAFEYSPEVEVTIGVPGTHVLSEAFPNPFNPKASFTLSVAAAQRVQVAVYDALGRQVALLHDGLVEAGQAQPFTFEGAGLPSGTYLLRAQGEAFQEARKLVLAK